MSSTLSPGLRAQLLAALAGWFERPDSSSVSLTPENHLLYALGAASKAAPDSPFCALFDQLWELTMGCDEGLVLHELEVEHARLYLDPSDVRIAPYEHSFGSRHAAELESDLRESYGQHGLKIGPAVRDLADHISLELEFQARLLAGGHEQEARAFFEQHLSSFHPHLTDQLGKRTTGPFHKIVADALRACMELEAQVLKQSEPALEPSPQAQNQA